MNPREWTRAVSAILAASSLMFAWAVRGAPASIVYTGVLKTAGGPVNGSVDVSISLFSGPAGGSPVWGPQQFVAVDVEGGLLRLAVGGAGGPSLDLALATHEDLWAEIAIDSDLLTPRQRLGGSAFAIVADDASRLGTLTAAEYVTLSAYIQSPSTSAVGAEPPSNPAAGQLWYDSAVQALRVWDAAGASWVSVSTGALAPQELPPNGIAASSAGVVSNEFSNVSHLWSEGAQIADASNIGPGAPALATVAVAEDPASYLTGLTIFTNFSLVSGNDISMKLFPPEGTAVSEIVLHDGVLTFGPYSEVWTLENTPALAELVDKNPSGTWTLAIVDRDDNLANPGTAGALNSFELRYDVVRSDHIQATGVLSTDTALIADTLEVTGPVLVTGELEVAGDVSVRGELVRPVQHWAFTTQESPSSSFLVGRAVTFTKYRDDTILRIVWNDNVYTNTTSSFYFDLRVDGQNCALPGLMRFYNQHPNSSNAYMYRPQTFVGYCQRLAGATTDIPAGEHHFTIFVSNNSPTVGHGPAGNRGTLTIEEVYAAP